MGLILRVLVKVAILAAGFLTIHIVESYDKDPKQWLYNALGWEKENRIEETE